MPTLQPMRERTGYLFWSLAACEERFRGSVQLSRAPSCRGLHCRNSRTRFSFMDRYNQTTIPVLPACCPALLSSRPSQPLTGRFGGVSPSSPNFQSLDSLGPRLLFSLSAAIIIILVILVIIPLLFYFISALFYFFLFIFLLPLHSPKLPLNPITFFILVQP
ncbi:hypothetical protein BJX76DRAFT_1081 [Aspergillus varians]